MATTFNDLSAAEALLIRDQSESGNAYGEQHFVCSRQVGKRLIQKLMEGTRVPEGGAAPFYVFSAEKRRVRITVFRGV